ncbi:DUF899 family protein [Nonomuraea sp. NPDC049158]|uniref:DUF899 family protein n=1 Tax=Nonomuraea sp. NPDC049158 TaxID=3155649 RepID=UPI0033BFB9EC
MTLSKHSLDSDESPSGQQPPGGHQVTLSLYLLLLARPPRRPPRDPARQAGFAGVRARSTPHSTRPSPPSPLHRRALNPTTHPLPRSHRGTWVSSHGSDFNHDYGVSFTPEQQADGATYNFRPEAHPAAELPGMSAFALQDGTVYHTYSSYARGADSMISAYQLLDRTPHGRNEDDLPYPMAWVRRHDEYTP